MATHLTEEKIDFILSEIKKELMKERFEFDYTYAYIKFDKRRVTGLVQTYEMYFYERFNSGRTWWEAVKEFFGWL